MKKIIISLFILICVSGCWNYKELNDYSIVTGVAIDKKNDEYEVSVLISNSPKNSTDSNSTESQIVVYSGTGESIFKAFKDLGLTSPKEIYLGGFSILVLSDEIAEEGINNAIDFFLRYSSSRNNFYVIISRESKAKDTLKIMTPISNFPSQNISDNIKSTTNLQGIIKTVDFDELTSTLLRDGIDPTINSVYIVGDVEEGSSTENLKLSEPDAYVRLGNLAIFKNDKLVDWSTHSESLGINIINGKISEMYLNIDYNDGYVVVDTTTFSSKVKTKVENNNPIVDINLKGEAKILEVKGDIDLEDYKVIEKLQEKSNELIKSYVNEAIDLSIKNKSDIFGIGLNFYRNHYNYYKTVKDDWENVLGKVKFNISSELTLKNKVSSKNSLEETHDK